VTLNDRATQMKRTGLNRGVTQLKRTQLRRSTGFAPRTSGLATVTRIHPERTTLPVRAPRPPRPAPSRARKNPAQRDTGPALRVRLLVLRRDWGCCVRCGLHLAGGVPYSLHHRRDRGSGGTSRPDTNSPVNLITLCGTGTTGCHGWVTENRNRLQALRNGWVVPLNGTPEHTSPALRPVLVHGLGRKYPTHDGQWADRPDDGAAA
jgi:hypothetical protein